MDYTIYVMSGKRDMSDQIIDAVVISGSVVVVSLISGTVLNIPLVVSPSGTAYVKLAAAVLTGIMLVDFLKTKKLMPDNW